jgi:ubiquitin-protein ligase
MVGKTKLLLFFFCKEKNSRNILCEHFIFKNLLRFAENKDICTSFTSYHPESWSTSWNIEQMLTGFVSFFNSNEIGTGGISTSTA